MVFHSGMLTNGIYLPEPIFGKVIGQMHVREKGKDIGLS